MIMLRMRTCRAMTWLEGYAPSLAVIPCCDLHQTAQRLDGQSCSLSQLSLAPGRSRHAGLIKKLKVSNFMCHELMEVEFGKNVNFIV